MLNSVKSRFLSGKTKLFTVFVVSFCLSFSLLAQSSSDISSTQNTKSNVSSLKSEEPAITPNTSGLQNQNETDEYPFPYMLFIRCSLHDI